MYCAQKKFALHKGKASYMYVIHVCIIYDALF